MHNVNASAWKASRGADVTLCCAARLKASDQGGRLSPAFGPSRGLPEGRLQAVRFEEGLIPQECGGGAIGDHAPRIEDDGAWAEL